jgi:hypothetical protein
MDRQRRSRNRKILKQQQEPDNNTLVLKPGETLTMDMLTDCNSLFSKRNNGIQH